MTTHQPLDATVLAVWFRPLVDYLEFKNLDSRAFCRRYNLDVDHVFSPGVRVPLKDVAYIWRDVEGYANCPLMVYELAKHSAFLQGDSVGICMATSLNLYESLQSFVRLSSLICEGVDIFLERRGSQLTLNLLWQEPYDHLPHEAIEAGTLPVVSFLNRGLAAHNVIKEIRFIRNTPSDEVRNTIESVWGTRATFNADNLAIVFDWELCQNQNPYWNPSLSSMAESLALENIESLNSSNVSQRVKKALLEELRHGTPTLKMIANKLNTTERNLQRKLEAQGITYRQLHDHTLYELACSYLQDPMRTLVDISISLGFKDQSNFTKAFKRWSGRTPGQFRKK